MYTDYKFASNNWGIPTHYNTIKQVVFNLRQNKNSDYNATNIYILVTFLW